jgi:hypothetical protein
MRGALAAPARIGFALELHALAFVQLVEDGSFDAGRVKEQLLTALVANEAEASIPNQARDRPGFGHAAHFPSAPVTTPLRGGRLSSTGSPSVRDWWPDSGGSAATRMGLAAPSPVAGLRHRRFRSVRLRDEP